MSPQRADDRVSPGWPRTSLILIVALLAVLALAQAGPGKSVLRLIGLSKAPPAYSALYFPGARSLPATRTPGPFAFPIPFAVDNQTATARTYQWTLTTMVDGKSAGTSIGYLAVRPGATGVTRPTAAGTCKKGTVEIKVTLASPAESIDFRVACHA